MPEALGQVEIEITGNTAPFEAALARARAAAAGIGGVGGGTRLPTLDTSKLTSAAKALETSGGKVKEVFRDMAGAIASVQGPLGPIAGRLNFIGSTFGRVGVAVGAFSLATAAATFAAQKAVRAFAEEEEQLLTINAVLKSTGYAAGQTSKQLVDLATSVSRTTMATDDQVRSAEALLLTFRSVSGDAFPRAIRAAQDMAAVMGGSLTGATMMLGKALEDPANRLAALTRAGITFTGAQKELIRQLTETGQTVRAQSEFFKVVERQVGGAGAGQASGLSGAWHRFSEATNDATVALGEFIAKGVGLVGWINSITIGLNALTDGTITLGDSLALAAIRMQRLLGIISFAEANRQVEAWRQELLKAGEAAKTTGDALDQLKADVGAVAAQMEASRQKFQGVVDVLKQEAAEARLSSIEQETLAKAREAGVKGMQKFTDELRTQIILKRQNADLEAGRLRSMDRSTEIAIAAKELELVGKSIEEQTRLRSAYAETMQLRLEAAKQGIKVDENEIKSIEAKAAALARWDQQLREANKSMELEFARQTQFLSDTEQEVAGALQDVFGPTWQHHMDDTIAQQVRLQSVLQQSYDITRDFAGTLVDDLIEGKSAVDSLTDAFKNLEKKILDMALDAVIKGLFSALSGGGSAGGGIFGSLLGLAGGGGGTTRTPGRFASGGYVGSTPTPTYGGGKLGYSEFPAILHVGERVIPAGGGSPPHISGASLTQRFGGVPKFAGGFDSYSSYAAGTNQQTTSGTSYTLSGSGSQTTPGTSSTLSGISGQTTSGTSYTLSGISGQTTSGTSSTLGWGTSGESGTNLGWGTSSGTISFGTSSRESSTPYSLASIASAVPLAIGSGLASVFGGSAAAFGKGIGALSALPTIRPGTPNLRYGMRNNEEVRQMQIGLNRLGYNLDEDGVFGPQTYRVLREFEQNNNRRSGVPVHPPRGVYGPQDALNMRDWLAYSQNFPGGLRMREPFAGYPLSPPTTRDRITGTRLSDISPTHRWSELQGSLGGAPIGLRGYGQAWGTQGYDAGVLTHDFVMPYGGSVPGGPVPFTPMGVPGYTLGTKSYTPFTTAPYGTSVPGGPVPFTPMGVPGVAALSSGIRDVLRLSPAGSITPRGVTDTRNPLRSFMPTGGPGTFQPGGFPAAPGPYRPGAGPYGTSPNFADPLGARGLVTILDPGGIGTSGITPPPRGDQSYTPFTPNGVPMTGNIPGFTAPGSRGRIYMPIPPYPQFQDPRGPARPAHFITDMGPLTTGVPGRTGEKYGTTGIRGVYNDIIGGLGSASDAARAVVGAGAGMLGSAVVGAGAIGAAGLWRLFGGGSGAPPAPQAPRITPAVPGPSDVLPIGPGTFPVRGFPAGAVSRPLSITGSGTMAGGYGLSTFMTGGVRRARPDFSQAGMDPFFRVSLPNAGTTGVTVPNPGSGIVPMGLLSLEPYKLQPGESTAGILPSDQNIKGLDISRVREGYNANLKLVSPILQDSEVRGFKHMDQAKYRLLVTEGWVPMSGGHAPRSGHKWTGHGAVDVFLQDRTTGKLLNRFGKGYDPAYDELAKWTRVEMTKNFPDQVGHLRYGGDWAIRDVMHMDMGPLPGGGLRSSSRRGRLVPSYGGGGVVGSTPVWHRMVDSKIFKNAPSFREGGEVPAILHSGETVIPAGGRSSPSAPIIVNTPAAASPVITINVTNNASASVSTNTQAGENGGARIDIMIDELVSAKMRDGGSRIARTMGSMGARTPPVRR